MNLIKLLPGKYPWRTMSISALYIVCVFSTFSIFAKPIDSLIQVTGPVGSEYEWMRTKSREDFEAFCRYHEELCDYLFPECDEDDEECDEEELDPVEDCYEDDEECDEEELDPVEDCFEDDEECDEEEFDLVEDCFEDDEECDEEEFDPIEDCFEDDEECDEEEFDPIEDCFEDDEECDEEEFDPVEDCDQENDECDDEGDDEGDGSDDQPTTCDPESEDCTVTLPPCDPVDGEVDEEDPAACVMPVTPSGFVNPNPEADRTILTVDKELADSASRFLQHATFGVNYATISQVASFGEAEWLETQFEQPIGYLTPYSNYLIDTVRRYEEQLEMTGEEENPAQFELIFNYLGDPEQFYYNAWWTQAVTSPDMVRQRVAMALSEIFVVSARSEEIGTNPHAMATYYDVLLTHSLGNFRDLLLDVSLSPTMGFYLSHLNNRKSDPTAGTYPDENYAREVMQLFSIGLFELNIDGTRKKDSNGDDIPTYGQDEIREFAKIFTGLGFGGWNEQFGAFDQGPDLYAFPMRMYEEQHEPGEKRLLNGTIVPAGQTGMQDIEAAIDNLFNHPNVGPFIGKQLIQRLVKSNPSAAYVSRVASAFNGGNGNPRGDMKSVIRAILLDPEARTVPQQADVDDGRLREPFLRAVHLTRAFNAGSSDNTINDNAGLIGELIPQYVLNAPSVFNFFQPGYAPNGELKDAGLVAPEFQVTNASTIISTKNYLSFALEDNMPLDEVGALPRARLDLSEEIALASDIDALLDRLDTTLTYGTLTQQTRSIIKNALEEVDSGEDRVRLAIYLMMVSPDYVVAI